MTPATFIVSALVLPINRKTLILRPKAAAALDRKIGMSRCTCTKRDVVISDKLGAFCGPPWIQCASCSPHRHDLPVC